MIIDNIKNGSLYYNLSERMTVALKYLASKDFVKMEPGKYDIDGENIYVIVNSYETKLEKEGAWEAHRRYIDIQYLAEGYEKIGYANIEKMKFLEDYNEKDDFLLLEGEGDFFTLRAGTFAIFTPDDAHMPGISVKESSKVKKVVVKVLV